MWALTTSQQQIDIGSIRALPYIKWETVDSNHALSDQIYSLAAESDQLLPPLLYTLVDLNHRPIACKTIALTN